MTAIVINVKIFVFIFLEFSVAKLAASAFRIVMKNSAFQIIFSEYSRQLAAEALSPHSFLKKREG
jgi:hypothetical protein